MDADETRIIKVFGAEEVPEVSKENLLTDIEQVHIEKKVFILR
jgi:hypothetical protein